MRRTKIVCTMGPNTNSRDLMKKLIETGMDVARFNFSHGDHDEQKMRMDMLKELRKELKTPVIALYPHHTQERFYQNNSAHTGDNQEKILST